MGGDIPAEWKVVDRSGGFFEGECWQKTKQNKKLYNYEVVAVKYTNPCILTHNLGI